MTRPKRSSKRLADYHTKTVPILELFRGKEKIISVDGTKPAAEVQANLSAQARIEGLRNYTRILVHVPN